MAADRLIDRRLDRIITGRSARRECPHLRADFSCTPADEGVIGDRQRVGQGIRRGTSRAGFDRFAERMDRVRRELVWADARSHQLQVARWPVDAADDYCCASWSCTRGRRIRREQPAAWVHGGPAHNRPGGAGGRLDRLTDRPAGGGGAR